MHGVAVGDYNNDGFRTFHHLWGRAGFFAIPAKELSLMPRVRAVSSGVRLSTSALWFDYDRDACWTSLYATTCAVPEHDVFCSLDGAHKSYCKAGSVIAGIPAGSSQSRQRNFRRRDRHKAAFLTAAKSLGSGDVRLRPGRLARPAGSQRYAANKLYRNLQNGKFKDVAVEAGWRSARKGSPRRHGRRHGDFDGSGKPGVAITNFDNERSACIAPPLRSFRRPCPFIRCRGGIEEYSWIWLHVLDVDLMALWTWRWPMATSTKRPEYPRQHGICPSAATLFEIAAGKISGRRSNDRRRVRDSESWTGLAYGDFDRDGIGHADDHNNGQRTYTGTIKRGILGAFDFA